MRTYFLHTLVWDTSIAGWWLDENCACAESWQCPMKNGFLQLFCMVSLTHSFSFTDQPNRRETLSDYGNHELTVIYRYSVSGETSSTPSCSVGASGNSRTLLECVILLHSANSSFALLSWTIFYSQVGLLIGLAIFGASLLALRGKHSTNDISEKSTSRQSTPIKGHQTPPRQIKKTAAATGSVHTPAGRRSARIARKKVEHND